MQQRSLPWQTDAAARSLSNIAALRNRASPQFWDDYAAYSVTFPSLAPGFGATQTLQFAADSTFEWVTAVAGELVSSTPGSITTPANGPLGLFQITDAGAGRNLLNVSSPLASIAGTATFPHVLPIARRFVPKSQITFNLVNLDSALTLTSTQFTMQGRKLFAPGGRRDMFQKSPISRFNQWTGQDGKLYAEDWYSYTFAFPAIAAGATVTTTVIIEQDADFEWVMTSIAGNPRNATTGNNTSVATSLLQAQVTDGSYQRALYNAPLWFPNFGGIGQTPFILPQSRIFEARTPVIMAITNPDSVAYNLLYVTLEGRKIFQPSYA